MLPGLPKAVAFQYGGNMTQPKVVLSNCKTHYSVQTTEPLHDLDYAKQFGTSSFGQA
jgi:hypothetical protein